MLKGKLSKAIKKDIAINTKFVVFVVLICLLSIGLYYSYALFQINVIKNGIVKIETASLNVALTSNELVDNKTIAVNGNNSKTVTITITNYTDVDLDYAVYAVSSINNITFSSETVFDESGGYFRERVSANSSIVVTIDITNNNAVSSLVDFNLVAGFPNYELDIPDNVNIIPIIKAVNYLSVNVGGNSDTSSFMNSSIIRNTIEKITFMNTNVVPSGVLGSFDISAKKNGSIMAWYYDTDENSLYEVYIGGVDGVYANPDSSSLFCNMKSLKEVDLTYFYVTNAVTNMFQMFAVTTNLTSLDVSNFDTSGVINMQGIFAETKGLTNLDLSNWNTASVTNMNNMFAFATNLVKLDLSSFTFTSVTTSQSIFAATNASLEIIVKDQAAYDFIYSKVNASQKLLLKIKP